MTSSHLPPVTYHLPLVVITGPTASGKTSLAISLARQFDGEVVSADSRAIYAGMDIGSAKPSIEERQGIVHWGFDLVEPGQRFTAADFKLYAEQKIADIRSRGKLPILVGGTGLYVDAVIFDYQFGQAGDQSRRRELEKMSIEELQDYCSKHNINLPENSKNKRYLVRAIEQKGINHKRREDIVDDTIVVGISTDRDVLRAKIKLRAEQMLTNDVVEEATLLGKKYGWNNEAMTGNVYPLVQLYLSGEISADEMIDKFTTLDWRLAKRQLTWLKRNPHIYWGDAEQLQSHIASLIEHKL